MLPDDDDDDDDDDDNSNNNNLFDLNSYTFWGYLPTELSRY
jgi:hypothetical protein